MKRIYNAICDFCKWIQEASCGIPELGAGILFVIAIPFLLIGAIIYETCFAAPKPPPPTIEQVRENRNEKAHEAGKTVREFLRGVAGEERKP